MLRRSSFALGQHTTTHHITAMMCVCSNTSMLDVSLHFVAHITQLTYYFKGRSVRHFDSELNISLIENNKSKVLSSLWFVTVTTVYNLADITQSLLNFFFLFFFSAVQVIQFITITHPSLLRQWIKTRMDYVLPYTRPLFHSSAHCSTPPPASFIIPWTEACVSLNDKY